MYPTPTNTPGSFGLLDVGPPRNDVPAFQKWVDDGETPNDIKYLLNQDLLPVSFDSPKSWKCGPGLKDTLESAFASQIGQPNLIPIFKAVQYPATQSANLLSTVLNLNTSSGYVAASSTGQNATYAIVGFVGVTVSSASGSGSGLNISIQPMAVIDPTAVIGNLMPAGTQTSPLTPTLGNSTTITTFGSAKLTN